MNILVSVNSKYVNQLNILLNSIKYSNKEEKFDIFILHRNLNDEDKEKIVEALDVNRFTLKYIKISDSEIEKFPIVEKRYPEEIYFRLFASKYLPEDIDKVLYLDADTIVINNLKNLYETDFEGNYFVAATHIKKVLHKFHEIRLDIKEDEPYINTGVLLINLKLLRKIDVEKIVKEYIKNNSKKLLLPDQDIVTALFGNKIKLVDELKYNLGERVLTLYNINNSKNKLTLKWIKENTVIIHFYGRNKPWNKEYIGALDVFYKKIVRKINKERPKKVLILSCGTGGGHNSAAMAVKQALNDKNIKADFKEYLEIVNPRIKDKVNNLYINSTKHNGKIFKKVYKLGELYQKTKFKSPVYSFNWLNRNKLYEYIVENSYNYIITTHLFAAQCLTAIKKEHNIHFVAIATDYVSIPFWEETDPDYFIIPSSKLKQDFINRGIKEEKLLPLGIPVQRECSLDYNKEEIRKELNLKLDKKYILILTGSMGFGSVDKMIDKLLEKLPNCKFIVSCGKNKKLLKILEEKYKTNDNIIRLPFTPKLNLYIKASDLVLTKPGGLTTTEIATIGKPFIHTMPIPGCENYNAKFFKILKMSEKCDTLEEVVEKIKKVLENKELQEEMVKNQRKYINRNASYDIADLVIKEIGEKDVIKK